MLGNKVVDSSLLGFRIVVRTTVCEECALQALQDTRIRLSSIFVKPISVGVLHIFDVAAVLGFLMDSSLFFFVLAAPEILEAFQITDPFCCPLFILTQFHYSTLNLSFLIIHAFFNQDGVHHIVLRRLTSKDGADTRLQVLVTLLIRENHALGCGGHSRPRFHGSIHIIMLFWIWLLFRAFHF